MRQNQLHTSEAVNRILRSAFSRGVGSVLSMPGGYFRIRQMSSSADAKALASDWARVGNQIYKASSEISPLLWKSKLK